MLLFNNLRAKQLETFVSPGYLEYEIRRKNIGTGSLDRFNSLIVCLLGHGDKGVILGADGSPVLLNRLKYGFNCGECTALDGKPKVFIVLACQGDNEQIEQCTGTIVEPVQTWTMKAPVGTSAGTPSVKDFLSLMSSVEEFVSYGGN